MKRALTVVDIILALAVIFVAALAAKEAVVLEYGAREAVGAPAVLPDAARMALADYAPVVEGGLFGKGTLFKAAASSQAAPAGLVLVGTAEGAGYAIFMNTETGTQRVFRKGEAVFGNGALAAISTKQAEIESNGGRVLYKVPVAMPAGPQASSRGGQIATSQGDGRWAIDQRAVAGIFDNMDKVLTDARFTPYVDDGKLSGFRVSEVRSGGVFNLIGLQDGDVVLSINDYKLDSPGKVAQVLGGLRGATEVRVDVLRGRQPRTLRYQIR